MVAVAADAAGSKFKLFSAKSCACGVREKSERMEREGERGGERERERESEGE